MDSTSSIPDGPGLFVVSQNGGNEVADIVFVHGLGGHPYKSWNTENVFWPQDFLRKDIPDARIMTFGYDTSPAMLFVGKNMEIVETVARNLLMELFKKRVSEHLRERPIIFVAHSLGGVIAKEALVMSFNSLIPEIKAVATRTYLIIFMGTPQIGSNIGNWASVFDRMIKAVTQSRNLAPAPIEDLRKMASVQVQFHEIMRGPTLGKLHIVCCYEERAQGSPGQLIVSIGNATLPGYSSFGIDSNHLSMTKFQNQIDSGYQMLLGELRKALLIIREKFSLSADGGTESAPPQSAGENFTGTAITAGRHHEDLEDLEKQSIAMISQLSEQAQFEEAEELLRELVDRRMLVFEEDNLITIKLWGLLASIMWQQGRWPQAENIQAANMEKMTRLLGQNHPDTLLAKQNLALTWVDMGLIERARDLQRGVLCGCIECFGHDHLKTINSQSNLAVILTRAQQFEEANALLRQVLMSSQRVLGGEHPITVTAGSNLASLYNEMGRFHEAEELQTRQVDILQCLYGPTYSDTLTALDSLASAMSSLGKLEEASEIIKGS